MDAIAELRRLATAEPSEPRWDELTSAWAAFLAKGAGPDVVEATRHELRAGVSAACEHHWLMRWPDRAATSMPWPLLRVQARQCVAGFFPVLPVDGFTLPLVE
jgi:hypothetical protein